MTMALNWLLLLSLGLGLAAGLAVGVPTGSKDNSAGGGGSGSANESWTFFLFVQTSPPGDCFFNKDVNCSYPSNSTPWTMHGIWPTLNNSLGPNYCSKVNFSLSVVEDLLPQLIRQWPNVETNTPLDSFWSHEWEKHGSCASGINLMADEHGFFNTTLALHERANYTTLLSNQGIEPSYDHKYKTDVFNTAFKNALGVLPLLECLYSPDMGQVLYQISICLRKDFSIMPCPPYVFESSRTKCYDTQTFLYIPHKTNLMYRQELMSSWYRAS